VSKKSVMHPLRTLCSLFTSLDDYKLDCKSTYQFTWTKSLLPEPQGNLAELLTDIKTFCQSVDSQIDLIQFASNDYQAAFAYQILFSLACSHQIPLYKCTYFIPPRKALKDLIQLNLRFFSQLAFLYRYQHLHCIFEHFDINTVHARLQQTLMNIAVTSSDCFAVEYLLEHGAHVDVPESSYNNQTSVAIKMNISTLHRHDKMISQISRMIFENKTQLQNYQQTLDMFHQLCCVSTEQQATALDQIMQSHTIDWNVKRLDNLHVICSVDNMFALTLMLKHGLKIHQHDLTPRVCSKLQSFVFLWLIEQGFHYQHLLKHSQRNWFKKCKQARRKFEAVFKTQMQHQCNLHADVLQTIAGFHIVNQV